MHIQNQENRETSGRELCNRAFIWDDHCGFEMTPDAPIAPLLKPWRDAGIDYFSINVYYDPVHWTRCLENISALRRRIPLEAPWCRIVTSVADIDAAHASRQAAVTFDIEGMNALNGRIDLVQTYYELGVRHMLFAYNINNLAGAGCHDEDTGLTDFGRAVIDEMNRVGMIIDCSHSNSGKDHRMQPVVFKNVLEQRVNGNPGIVGVMLESHLHEGRQDLGDDPSKLKYGVSITDACMGWEDTERLIREAHGELNR